MPGRKTPQGPHIDKTMLMTPQAKRRCPEIHAGVYKACIKENKTMQDSLLKNCVHQ
jgi:hypothetical protein